MMELHKANMENTDVLKAATKLVVQEARLASKETYRKIEAIRQAAKQKDDEVKKEVWKQHMNSIVSLLQESLKDHSNI